MKPIFPIMILLCILSFSAAGEDQEGAQLLKDARHQANIFHKDAEPFQLEADFVAQIQTPLHGHVTLKWESSDHWWRKITMSDFVQIDVRNGEKEFVSRNSSFTPERINELIGMLQFAVRSEGIVKKAKQRVEDSIEMTCLRVDENVMKQHTLHEICMNASSHEILQDEWTWGADEQRVEHYSDYADFQGRRYPQKLELTAHGSKVITATVTGLTKATFDEAALAPPKGAREGHNCQQAITPPVALKTPDPLYPKSASQNRMMGDTVVSITVAKDGSVSDVHLLGGATQSMDDATMQTIKGWKFKPAMCGTEPVVTEVQVVVSFRLDR